MREWTIREEGYEEEKAAALGNRYLTGNGYLGIRGTLEEYEADRLPAINLAGIYDRSTGWRGRSTCPTVAFLICGWMEKCIASRKSDPYHTESAWIIVMEFFTDIRPGIPPEEMLRCGQNGLPVWIRYM